MADQAGARPRRRREAAARRAGGVSIGDRRRRARHAADARRSSRTVAGVDLARAQSGAGRRGDSEADAGTHSRRRAALQLSSQHARQIAPPPAQLHHRRDGAGDQRRLRVDGDERHRRSAPAGRLSLFRRQPSPQARSDRRISEAAAVARRRWPDCRRHAVRSPASGAGGRGLRASPHRRRHQHRAESRARGVRRARTSGGARPQARRVHQGTGVQLGYRGPLARHPRRRAARRLVRSTPRSSRSWKATIRRPISGITPRAGCSKADASSRRCSPSTTSPRSARSARCAKRDAACPKTSRSSASTTSRAPNSRIRV